MGKSSCIVCTTEVKSAGIFCNGVCKSWIHFRCLGITYSSVKKLKSNELEMWECPNCSKAILEDGNDNNRNSAGDMDKVAETSSILSEIEDAMLQENEELKQALYDEKNKSALHDLELEDKLNMKDEEIKFLIEQADKKEAQFKVRIDHLERKLKDQQKLNENLVLEAAQSEEKLKTELNFVQNLSKAKKYDILKEETDKMLSTIKTLETVIDTIQNENKWLMSKLETKEQGEKICLQCYPPLLPSKKTGTHHQKEKGQNYMKRSDTEKQREVFNTTNFTSYNPFDVLSDLCSENDECNSVVVDKVNSSKNCLQTIHGRNSNRRHSSNLSSSRLKDQGNAKHDEHSSVKKILLCADSHGRDLAFHINNRLNTKKFCAIGFVRPGGCTEQILDTTNIGKEKLESEDMLVIMCGTNDVARNEGQRAINSISSTLDMFPNRKVVLVDLPQRFDLKHWSLVNEEVRKTNSLIKDLCCKYPNVSLVQASSAKRHLHTQHGMHFNRRGKKWLAHEICKSILEEQSNPVTERDCEEMAMAGVSPQPSAELSSHHHVELQETSISVDQPSTSGASSLSGNGTQQLPQSSP